MAIETTSKVGTFCIIVVMIVALVAAGAIWSVTRWWHSVASSEVLFVLNREMHSVSHRRTAMVIEMARNGGTFVCRRRPLPILIAVIVAKDHVMVH